MPDLSVDLRSEFQLDRCVNWIKSNSFTKVCLQFPDSLLENSVDIALNIDKETENKTYILGDTSYGSCCIDEIAARHVDGEAIIHFGHACLSRTQKIPVLYILPQERFDIDKCINDIKYLFLSGQTLLLFDTSFSHLRSEIVCNLPEDVKSNVTVSEIIVDSAEEICGEHCSIKLNKIEHTFTRLSRGYCIPPNGKFDNVIYIGDNNVIDNFLLTMKDVQFYQYLKDGKLNLLNSFQLYKRMSFLVEKVKSAQAIGLLVGTLAVERYLEAIKHVKKLCKRRKRKFYIISVGRPTVAKLSNFPEIDVFVLISCPETIFLDNKSCVQPIVGLLEIELAFNENRSWDNTFSKDFQDLIEGGSDFIDVPDALPEDSPEISLVTSKMNGVTEYVSSSKELSLKPEMRLTTSDFSARPRTWDGLELNLGDTPVATAVKGRSGTAQGYSNELNTIDDDSKK